MNVELIYFPYGSADLSGCRTERALFGATLSDQVWDRRAETVKSKLSAVEMDLLQKFVAYFFSFTGLPGEIDLLAAAITNSLVSVSFHFIVTTASYVFVKYLNCCQDKSPVIFPYRPPFCTFEI